MKRNKKTFTLCIFLLFLISCSDNLDTDQNSYIKPNVDFLNCPTNVHIEDTLILDYEINAGSGSIQEVDIKILQEANVIVSYKVNSRVNSKNYKFLDPFENHIYSYELNNSAKIEQENYLFTIKITDNLDQVADAECQFAMKSG